MKISRRDVLRGASLYGLATTFGAGAFLSTQPAMAQVEYVVGSLQVIRSFVQRPDGLSPIMRGMNEKLNLVILEIAKIEQALADIQLAIADLRIVIPEMIKDALTEEAIDKLVGNREEWFGYKIKSIEDVKQLNDTKKFLVNDLIGRAHDRIYFVSTKSNGGIG